MRARTASSIVLAALIAVGTSSCTFITPQATQISYFPSDGFDATVGDIEVRNAILLTEGGSATGASLVVTLVNNSGDSQRVSFQHEVSEGSADRETRTVTAAPGLTKFGAEDSQRITFDTVEPTPGSLTKIYIQYGDAEGVEMDVPVLNGDQETYTNLVPGETGSTPDTTVTTTPVSPEGDEGLGDSTN
ncbi:MULTISPECIES: hypothetical protein [Clavibacter]|uniref:hypothetical protein n=1 Tax=Clavibacter TaxID=1573 RepID=UPI001BE0EE55|nr:hypothetical protein [Clavibacter michiganensis]MBT1634530.1 hypothetical protein [Clavibacter michiganensis]